jgi:hypothetical protein
MVGGMQGTVGRRDALALVALILVGVGIPLLLSAAAGAIGVPSNDDWVYMRAAETLFRTGSIDMPGHTAAAIGQVLIVQPMLWISAGDLWAFTAFGLLMGLIGLVCAYLLARRFLAIAPAMLVVLLIEAFPGFARETASFMTDIPAYAFSMVCLLLGTRWLQGEGRRRTLVASLGAGLVAVSIREFAIAAPAAILIASWATNRAGERVWLLVVSSGLGAAVAGVLIAAASVPGRGLPVTPNIWQLGLVGPVFATLAAVVLPAAVLAMGRRMAKFSPEHLVLGAGLGCLVVILPGGPLIGQLWMPDGLVGNALLIGTRKPVIGADAWAVSEQLAAFAAVLVAALGLRWGQRTLGGVNPLSTAPGRLLRIARSSEAPLILFLLAYAGELVGLIALSYFPLDRYLYPMVPVAAILLLRGPARSTRLGGSHAFAHASLAWLVVSAFVINANSFAYDGARVRAGEAAVAMGYQARTVDAGYDWVGYHASGVGNAGSRSYGLTWYDDALSSSRPCVVLSNSLLDDQTMRLIRVDRSAYLQYLFLGPAEPLYMYGSLADGCPAPPPAVAATAP